MIKPIFLTRRAGAAALLLGTIVFGGATQAQEPMVPLAFVPMHHFPASPPSRRDALQTMPIVADGAYFGAGPAVPKQGPVWAAPQIGVRSPFITSSSGFTGLGPAPVLFGQDPGSDPVAGRITGLAVDPTDNNTFYLSAAGGGIWKTTSGGGSFTVLTDSLPDVAMGAVTVDPTSHNTVYAGSGEANFSGDSRYGAGVFKSIDGGASWTQYTGPGGAFVGNSISRIVVDPAQPSNVYLGMAYAGNHGRYGGWGVYKSTDGGQTWAYVFSPDSTSQISVCSDLAIDPSNPQVLYAAIGAPYGNRSYNTLNGIWKTVNGGTSWTRLANFPNGGTNNDVGRISLTLAASSPSTLYANYCSDGYSNGFGTLQGTYKTTDGGATWAALTTPDYLGGQGWYDDTLAASPTNANIVYAAGVVNYGAGSTNGIIGSRDGGATWADYSFGTDRHGPHTDHHALAFTTGGQLLNGNDGGLWRLADPTTTTTIAWTDLNTNLGITQFTGIALHPTDATIAYGGSQDNGTEKYTGSSVWSLVRGGDGGFTRVDQSSPNTVYHEYYRISLERSDDAGRSWTTIAGPGSSFNPPDPSLDGEDPAAFYVPYVLDPANQRRIIYVTDHVYESTNKGAAFTAIGTPGVGGFTSADSSGHGPAFNAVGVQGPTVYAATGGTLYVTANDGASWAKTTAVPGGGGIGDIYVNPNDTLDVIVTRASFGGGHLYRSNDGGASWADISGNLPNEPFNAVNADKRSGTLYAGGDDGVYLSTNFGGSWAKSNLPNVQVVDLAVSPGAGVVGAGTHGRGMFEAPLSTSVAASNIYVTASLSRSGGQLLATVVLKNSGSGDVTNAVLSSVTLNGAACTLQTAGAGTVGTVPAVGQAPAVVYVCPSAVAGTRAALRTSGGSDQGSFGSAAKITVP